MRLLNQGQVSCLHLQRTIEQFQVLHISNGYLAAVPIANYYQIHERRVKEWISVAHDTPRDVLVQIPIRVKGALEVVPQFRFTSMALFELSRQGLTFQLVFRVLGPTSDLHKKVTAV